LTAFLEYLQALEALEYVPFAPQSGSCAQTTML